MRLLIYFARSRGLVLLVPVVVVVAVWCWWVPTELLDNPLSGSTGSLLIALTGLGASVFVAMMFANPMGQLERQIAPDQLHRLRLVWLLTLVLILGLVGTVVFAARGISGWYIVMHWRNIIQGVALACCCACAMPRPAAWTIPAVALALCWLLGIRDLGGAPRLLAFPCYLPNSVLSWAVTGAAFVLAAVIYTRRDALPEDR